MRLVPRPRTPSIPPACDADPAAGLQFEQGATLAKGDSNDNPPGIGFVALLREDFRTHGDDLRSVGFWALAIHRLGNLRMDVRPRLLRAPLSLAYRAARNACALLGGIDLPYNARIGRRLHIAHHGCFFLNARAVGNDVTIRHGATLGVASRHELDRAPVIGHRVVIGPGACVVGGVRVGNDCYVGANSLLADDLLDGKAVLGVPGRVVDLDRHIEAPPRAQGRLPGGE